LGLAYAQKGQFPEAVAEAQTGTRLDDSPLWLAFLADVYARAGKRSEAKKVLSDVEQLAKRRYVCAYEIAVAYLSLGEKDRAFEWLERGYADRSECMVLLKVDPRVDRLRPDPRFQELMQRVGIPQ